jgi:hypothetical protein
MAGALAHEFFTPPDPSFAITQFNFDRDPKRMEAFSAVYDTYRDATLAEFRKRGGKLLIFHGTADPIFSALESIDYYQRLTRNNGGADATATWARLFPGAGHEPLRGGPATDSFDGLGAIVDWVEKGTAPARIEASARPGTTYFAGRTRPLCPYPSAARYKGTGISRMARVSSARGTGCARTLQLDSQHWRRGARLCVLRDVFGIELARSPFAAGAAATLAPNRFRPVAQAGSDPLVWDLTGTHGSRFRTVFMRAPNTPFGLELSEFFDVPRGERPPNPWDPGASKLVFAVRDLDVSRRQVEITTRAGCHSRRRRHRYCAGTRDSRSRPRRLPRGSETGVSSGGLGGEGSGRRDRDVNLDFGGQARSRARVLRRVAGLQREEHANRQTVPNFA